MSWTTTDLLTAIKNCQMLPGASDGSLSPEALVNYATDALYMTIVPKIQSVREKYYEKYVDTEYTQITTSLPIPYRAIAATTSYVQFRYGVSIWPLNPIDPATAATSQPRWPQHSSPCDLI